MSVREQANSIEAYAVAVEEADSIEAYVIAVKNEHNFIETSLRAIKIISILCFRYPTIEEYFMEVVANAVMKEHDLLMLHGESKQKGKQIMSSKNKNIGRN